MSYNKAFVSSRQKAVIKSITDLLDVLSEIDIDDSSGNGGEIVLDDGSVMTLSTNPDNTSDFLNVEKISVTNARLNLDIVVSRTKQSASSKDNDVIRFVKKKPDKIVLTRRKKDTNE